MKIEKNLSLRNETDILSVDKNPLFRKYLFLILCGVFILGLGYLLYSNYGTTTGKAYNIETTKNIASITDPKAMYFNVVKGYAQKDDTIAVKGIVKNVLSGAQANLAAVSFCLNYDPTKLDLTSATVLKTGWAFTSGALALNDLKTVAGGKGCPSGYSVAVDLNSDTSNQIINNNVGVELIELKFKVLGSYVSETPSTIRLLPIYMAGLNTDNSPWQISTGLTSSMSDLLIVPNCPDGDGDGYPNTITQINGNANSDLRACFSKLFDCDDTIVDDPSICSGSGVVVSCADPKFSVCAKCINPGVKEVCDGKNNNCDAANVVDEGLIGVPNTKLQGVCYGTQVCYTDSTTKITKWTDSYLVADVGIKFNGVQQSTLYETTETKCDFYDNDCDGSVNEGLTGCTVGGGAVSVGLLPTGNTFLTYDGSGNLNSVQTTDGLDASLLSLLNLARKSGTTSGDAGQLPYVSKLVGNFAWVCDSGLYYLELTSGTSTKIEKRYYQDTKVTVVSYTRDTATNKLMNGQTEVKC